MTDPRSVPQLRTPGVLAAALGEPLHRVVYLLRTRPHIKPSASAGRLRLYDREALDLLKQELRLIDTRRSKAVSHG